MTNKDTKKNTNVQPKSQKSERPRPASNGMNFKRDIKIFILAIILLFVGVLMSAVSQKDQYEIFKNREKVFGSDDIVRIGAIIPEEVSAQSKALKLGIELAKEDIGDIKEDAGMPGLEVLVRDSELDPEKGKQLASELAEQQVNAIYSSHTVITREVTEVAKENQLPLFYDSCNCGFAEENPLAFQMYFDPRKECREIAEDFKARGVEKAGFIGQDVPYGKYCYNEVQKVFGEENVEIKLESGPHLTFYGSLLKNWQEDGVGVVFSIPTAVHFPFLFSQNAKLEEPVTIACFDGVCLTEQIREQTDPEDLEHVIGFGFEINPEFENRILEINSDFAREDIVATAVSHDAITHAYYLSSYCGNDAICMQEVSQEINYPTAVKSHGFGEDNILIYESRR